MNPASSTPLFSDGSSPQQLYVKVFPDEELTDLLNLSNDGRGLFTSLRWYALKNSGLPAEREKIWEEVRYFAGISRYKFFKVIDRVLELKFEIFDGRFFVRRDEDRTEEARAKISKYRDFGKMGAEKRWKKPGSQDPQSNVVPMATPSDTPMAPSYLPDLASELPTIGVPPAAATTYVDAREVAAAAGPPHGNGHPIATPSDHPPPSEAAEVLNPVTDSEHEQFCKGCKANGITTPDRATSQRLKDRFPLLFPELPKLADDQKTPGLWMKAEPERVVREANRQRAEALNPTRKPNSSEAEMQAQIARVAAGARRLGAV